MEEESYGEDNNHTSGSSAVLSHHEKYVILMTLCGGGIAAIIVCLIAMVMAIKFKLHKYFVHRLAIYQVLSAMFYSSLCIFEVIFINYDRNTAVYHPICVVEAFVLEYAVWIKLLFTFCLTFHLFCFSVCHVNYSRLEVAYVLVSVLGPALFSWIPFIDNLYGEAGAWCWIQNWKNNDASNKLPLGEIEQYALYGVAMTCLILCGAAVVVVTIILICRAYRCHCCCCSFENNDNGDEHQPLLKEQQRKKVLREILPLVSYPILSLILYVPSFINRVIGSIFQTPIMIGFMWSAVTLPLVGLFAGVSLIVHIFILECPKRTTSNAAKQRQLAENERATNATNIFTSYTIASTNAKTCFEPPQESALDEELN